MVGAEIGLLDKKPAQLASPCCDWLVCRCRDFCGWLSAYCYGSEELPRGQHGANYEKTVCCACFPMSFEKPMRGPAGLKVGDRHIFTDIAHRFGGGHLIGLSIGGGEMSMSLPTLHTPAVELMVERMVEINSFEACCAWAACSCCGKSN